MKHIKTFEGRKIDEDSVAGLQRFYDKFEEDLSISRLGPYQNRILEQAQRYNIPEEFYDEFKLLYYLYDNRRFFATDKKIDAYIKKEVKKSAIKSIVEKLKNENVFLKLDKLIDSRPNFSNQGSRGYIHNGTVQYVFFSLLNAIRQTPEYELKQEIKKSSKKFNL